MSTTVARAVVLAGLVVSGGCEGVTAVLENEAQQVAEQLAEPATPRPSLADIAATSEDELLARKLRLYVECHSRATERIRGSWQRYVERIGADGTPRKKGTTPFLYKIDTELQPCEDAASRGPTMRPPRPAIESAMATYVEHGRTFATLSVELDSYFEKRLYNEDDWAKGKELAPGFRLAYEAWSESAATLERELGIHLDRLDLARLDTLERHGGRTLEWHARRLMLDTRAFMRCAIGSEAEADGCQPALDALAAADAEFRRSYDADPSAAEAVFWMTSFHESTATLLTRATEIVDARAKAPLSSEARRPLKRAFEVVVSDFNNLRFDQ